MTDSTTFGVSLPEEVLKQMDADRGDIPRSRYILRLVERSLGASGKQEQNRK